MDEMLKAKLMEAKVDVAAGLGRFMNNETLYMKFLNKFPDEPTYHKLKESLEAGDTPEAFRQAHTLKGVCGNLSLTVMAEWTEKLTELLRNKETLTQEEQAQAKAYMNEIDENYQKISDILNANRQ